MCIRDRISLGCPKNQVDDDVMCHALMERGHITTADLSEADAIIVEMCIRDRDKTERMKNEFISSVSHELRTPLTSICLLYTSRCV